MSQDARSAADFLASAPPELRVATEAVRRASWLTREVQHALVSEETYTKRDRSPVTVADFGAQALISLELAEHLPSDPVLGEEDAGDLRQDEGADLRRRVVERVAVHRPGTEAATVLDAIDRCHADPSAVERFWTLDPVDGTKGFLRNGQYAVALALLERGEVVLGALGCPNLAPDPEAGDEGAVGEGCVLVAQRGRGGAVFDLHGEPLRPLRVDDVLHPAAARFCESVEAAHSAHSHHARVAAALGIERPPLRIDSQAKYAALAQGLGSVYLRLPRNREYQEKIWDHAAGALMVEEAGGTVTDSTGRPLDFSAGATLRRNYGVIATNGHFHEEVLAAVKDVLD